MRVWFAAVAAYRARRTSGNFDGSTSHEHVRKLPISHYRRLRPAVLAGLAFLLLHPSSTLVLCLLVRWRKVLRRRATIPETKKRARVFCLVSSEPLVGISSVFLRWAWTLYRIKIWPLLCMNSGLDSCKEAQKGRGESSTAWVGSVSGRPPSHSKTGPRGHQKCFKSLGNQHFKSGKIHYL